MRSRRQTGSLIIVLALVASMATAFSVPATVSLGGDGSVDVFSPIGGDHQDMPPVTAVSVNPAGELIEAGSDNCPALRARRGGAEQRAQCRVALGGDSRHLCTPLRHLYCVYRL